MTWQSIGYFLLWAGLFALMMRFGCGAHGMGHDHDRSGASRSTDRDAAEGLENNSDRATDPVRGMNVSTARAKSAVYQTRAYYFCSTDCRDKFESAPEQYAVSAAKEHGHGC